MRVYAAILAAGSGERLGGDTPKQLLKIAGKSVIEHTLDAFEAATAYGNAAATSAATYHIASMYDELGRTLLSSERPASLSAEELAQYEALLIRQAVPFAQRANELYTANGLRSREEQRDPRAEKSVQQLKQLEPGY